MCAERLITGAAINHELPTVLLQQRRRTAFGVMQGTEPPPPDDERIDPVEARALIRILVKHRSVFLCTASSSSSPPLLLALGLHGVMQKSACRLLFARCVTRARQCDPRQSPVHPYGDPAGLAALD